MVSVVRESKPVTVIQTDATINPGNSGGGLIDREVRVIGVATLKILEGESLGFAVAADHVKRLLEGAGTRAHLGRLYRFREGMNIDSLTDDELELLLEQIVTLYKQQFPELRDAVSRCDALSERFEDLSGDRIDYALGELVVYFVQEHNAYARSGRELPEWHEMSCVSVRLVEKCYEAVVAYGEVYKSYGSQRRARGHNRRPSSGTSPKSSDGRDHRGSGVT
jgi:hypothetical protein